MKQILSTAVQYLQKPEYFYAATSLLFGLILSVIVPLGGNSDEPAHYYRSQQLAQFRMIATEDDFTQGMPIDSARANLVNQENYSVALKEGSEVRINTLDMKDTTGEIVRVKGFTGAAVYSPIAYAPQVLAVWVSKIFDLPINLEAIGMRLAGLAAQTTLIFFAISLLPRGKWFLAIFSLLPVMVIQSTAISTDAMTNGVSILFVSLLFALATSKNNARRLLAITCTTALLLGLIKVPYFLLALLLPLAVAVNKNLRDKRTIIIATAAAVLPAIAALLWTVAIGTVPSWLPDGVDRGEQVAHMLHSPQTAILAFLNSIFIGAEEFSRHATLIGMFMWDSTPLSPYFMALSVVAVTLSVFIKDGREISAQIWASVEKWRWIIAAFGAGMIMAISFALYVTYTRVGVANIEGIQGRYFLPFIPLVIIPFITRKNSIKATGVCISIVLCLVATIWTILSKFNPVLGA